MELIWSGIDIINYVPQYTWSGSARQAARMLEFSVVCSDTDPQIQSLDIKLGNIVKLYSDSDDMLFYGRINRRERNSSKQEIVYHAYDLLNHLLKSKGTYYFKNTTAEKITKAICDDLQIKTGHIAVTNIAINKMIVEEESFYNIILMAYTKVNKINGKKYKIEMNGDRLCVIEKGVLIEDCILREKETIQESNYAENIDSMINKVKIYDDQKIQIGEVTEADWMKQYGIFQSVYPKEEGINATNAAKNMLTGVSKTASIEATGDSRCISGYAIKIKDTKTNLSGKFWIENDTHTWNQGIYTMSLDLEFKNIMDIVEESGNTTKAMMTEDTLVWINTNGKRYHLKKTCSNLLNPREITVRSAKLLNKTACGTCIGG